MRGIELPEWRKRNGFTQDTLRIALGVKSRQTIITWEKATAPLPRLVELALLALENFPEHRNVTALATVHRTPIPASF
jgi:DNA-binding XRE family transcriptional regulator